MNVLAKSGRFRTLLVSSLSPPRSFSSGNRTLANMHATAKVKDTVVAETDSYEVVEGNVYVSYKHPSCDEKRHLIFHSFLLHR